MQTKARWARVSRSSRCPICDKPDWCRVSADGATAHCMRIESERPWRGPAGGWLHRLDGEQIIRPTPQPRPKRRIVRDWLAEARRCYEARPAADTRRWLSARLSIPVGTLELFRVGWGWDEHRQAEFSTWPERDAGGRIVGIRRRYRDGAKRSMEGGAAGLFYRPGWDRGGDVLVVEGGSDAAFLAAYGLSVLGRPSNASAAYLPEILRPVRARRIVVLGENDNKVIVAQTGRPHPPACLGCQRCWPGLYGAVTVAGTLAEDLGRPVLWCLPAGVKDVRGLASVFDGAPPAVIRGLDDLPLVEIGEARPAENRI